MAAGMSMMCMTLFSRLAAAENPARDIHDDYPRPGSGERLAAGVLQQKLQLLDRMINRSPSADRVRSSTNPEAKQLLREAEQNRLEALQAIGEGATERGEEFLSAGYLALSMATRQVSDPQRDRQRHALAYRQLRQQLMGFSEALHRLADGTPDSDNPVVTEIGTVQSLMLEAEQLAAKNDLPGANRQLQLAIREVEQRLSQALDSKTLSFRRVFSSPREAYDYELERNDSYARLARTFFVGREAESAGTVQNNNGLLVENKLRVAAAQRALRDGDARGAQQQLEQATELLIRALRAGGLGL